MKHSGEPKRPGQEGPEKLKICYLISEYPSLSHTFIQREIRELEKRGHQVLIASIRKPAHLEGMGGEWQAEASRTFFVLDSWGRGLGALARLARRKAKWKCVLSTWLRSVLRRPLRPASYAYLGEAVILLDWMMENGVTHVHNHFGNAAGMVAAIAAGSGLVKYSLSLHGPDIFYQTDTEMLREKLEWASFVRCISWYSLSQSCLLSGPEHWGKFEVVRCGVDPSVFALRPEPRNAVPRVLCVGRLVAAKGQRLLLEASQKLASEGCRHELVLVGAGPDGEMLRSYAKGKNMDHVLFAGGLNQSAVRAEYARSDLFVLPSFAEGVPVVLMEAMACGIAVISTRITGIPELITDEVDGLLVPPGNVESLAHAMGRLLRDGELRQRLGEAGRAAVCAEYDLNQNGARMAALMERNLKAAA